MIEYIIHFSIRHKFIIGLFILAFIGWGIYSLTRLPVDAIPDITNNQVQVISLAPSLATQEVESLITSPIEVSVANIPDIVELRSISRLGLSVVTVVFKDNVNIYWARQQLSERLKQAEDVIPDALATIELAPISTGLGEIFQYRLAVEKGFESKYTSMDLRTVQDWIVRREMLGTQGVADINSYGGYVKEYEIAVNPERLKGLNLTLNDIFDALERNNENTGSAYIDKNPNAYFIRGIGLVKNLDDIEKIVIKNNTSGVPVLIRDAATVQFGTATRYGAFVVDTSEAVGGVVMMLKGDNAHKVIDQVEKRIASIQKSLPEGIRIESYLNRSDLVGRAIGTVSRNLTEGALIVIFILVLLLGNMRAGLIVASVIPLAMLFAISLMNIFGVSGNLMSLGAIDFGLIVDGAVIIVESVVHRIFMSKHHHTGVARLTQQQMDDNVLESAKRMMSSATFGQIIILVVYLPIMALAGTEGKMFRPMAQVVTFALIGAIILSLTWVPMASALFLSKNTVHRRNISDKIMDRLHKGFDPVMHWVFDRKKLITLSAGVLFIVSLFIFSRLGGEFIPQLEEGDLAAGVMTLQGGSLSHTIETIKKANKILLDSFPEIKHAVCKIGAGEIPTDPTPMETGDYIITLKDKNEWTSAKTREELVAAMEEKLVVLAGVKFEFQQPIQMRFNELMTGSRQDVAIKIFGDDLGALAEIASETEKLIQPIAGVQDINVEKVTGLAQIQVNYNRDRLAQYGLNVADANRVLRTAFAGSQAGVVFEEEKRFGLVVRLDKEYRANTQDVKSLSIALGDGTLIPFEQIADISIKSGPAQVSRENTRRRITVGFNVRNRDVESVISEVTQLIDKRIKLPAGYYVTYGGEFQNLQAARARLSFAVPVALLMIFVLLYFTFHSVKQTLLILSAVPLSAIGGIFALWIRGMNFSISAGVGFIALFGVAVLNGIVLIAEFNRLEKEGITDMKERVLKGLHTRLRPVIMTAAVASMGFLPMALSVSAGAEVQKPLATVVIGGLITATLLTLIVLPVFYMIFSSRKLNINTRIKNLKPGVMIFLVVASSFFTKAVNAQNPEKISVQKAIQIALDSNLSMRASSYELEMLKALRGESWDLGKTDVEVQYGQFNSYTKDNSISISQSVDFPWVYVNRSKLANAKVTGNEWEVKKSEIGLASQVKQTYWQLVYLTAKKNLLEYQDSLFRQFLKATELRSVAGEVNRLELVNARSQSMEIGNFLRQTVMDVNIQKRKLQNLLNTKTNYVPEDAELTQIETDWNDTLDTGQNPSLAFMQQQVNIARREKNLERSQLWPGISIGYFSQTMQGTQEIGGIPRSFGPGDRFTGIQAGLSIPLWFAPNISRIKAATIREKIAVNQADFYTLSMKSGYQNLVDEYRKYKASVDYYEKQALAEAELIIEQSGKSFSAGSLDYTEHLFNVNRAISIRQNYIESLNNLNQTVIQMEYFQGKIY